MSATEWELREHTNSWHIEHGKLLAQWEISFRAKEDKGKEEEEEKQGKEKKEQEEKVNMKENMKVQENGNYIFHKYNYGW